MIVACDVINQMTDMCRLQLLFAQIKDVRTLRRFRLSSLAQVPVCLTANLPKFDRFSWLPVPNRSRYALPALNRNCFWADLMKPIEESRVHRHPVLSDRTVGSH